MRMELEKRRICLTAGATVATDLCVRLNCEDGFFVELGSIGASIRRIRTRVADGTWRDLAISFKADTAWLENELYAGAVLAPSAGRIANAQLHIGEKCVPVEANEGANNLHGGSRNASFMAWYYEGTREIENGLSVTFTLALPDGLCGFPGNRELRAVYTLTEDHKFGLELEAVSDRDTCMNLSNHLYLNLNGDFTDSALDMPLQINAQTMLTMSPVFIPEEVISVADTAFDFRTETRPRENLHRHPEDRQAIISRGYNNNYLLSSVPDETGLCHALTIFSSDRLVQMDLYTDADSFVMYSGGWIPEGLPLVGGMTTTPSCAIAFECQKPLDRPDKPLPFTNAGQIERRRILWRFS